MGSGTDRCDRIVPVWERFLGLLALCHQGQQRSASRGPLHPFPSSQGILSMAGNASSPLSRRSQELYHRTGPGRAGLFLGSATRRTPGATPSPWDVMPRPGKPRFLQCPNSWLSPHVLLEMRASLGVRLAVPSSFPPSLLPYNRNTSRSINSRQ